MLVSMIQALEENIIIDMTMSERKRDKGYIIYIADTLRLHP